MGFVTPFVRDLALFTTLLARFPVALATVFIVDLTALLTSLHAFPEIKSVTIGSIRAWALYKTV